MNAVAVPSSPEPTETANSHRHPIAVDVRRPSSQDQYRVPGITSRSPSDSTSLSPERNEYSPTSSTPSDFPRVQEVWFAGCHSDVGSGSVEDTVRYSLGDISLRWMVKQVKLSGCRIEFDPAALRRADIDVSDILLAGPTEATTISSAPLAPHGEGGSEDENRRELEARILSQVPEVRADIHDELTISFSTFSWIKLRNWIGFWVLETIIPATFIWQDADGTDRRERQ